MKTKLKVFLIFMLTLSITSTFAQPIATCGKTEGFAMYHHVGLIKKKDSGFSKDEISSGLTTIQKTDDGNYDILMVDSRKKIMSLTQEGGKVMLLRKGANDATFMHFYPGMVIELYTIWVDVEGKSHYDLVQSKGGDAMPIHKSAVLTGRCDSIRFDLIN
jgi:hypothetical protein